MLYIDVSIGVYNGAVIFIQTYTEIHKIYFLLFPLLHGIRAPWLLTLKPSYLDGLSTGKHTLKISFEDEYAGAASIEVDFTVEDNPDTADLPVETFIVFGSCLALGATSMAYMINRKSRR